MVDGGHCGIVESWSPSILILVILCFIIFLPKFVEKLYTCVLSYPSLVGKALSWSTFMQWAFQCYYCTLWVCHWLCLLQSGETIHEKMIRRKNTMYIFCLQHVGPWVLYCIQDKYQRVPFFLLRLCLCFLRSFSKTLGQFYSHCQPEFWWWELTVVFRKIVMSVLQVFGAKIGDMQIHVSLLFIAVGFVVTMHVRPFTKRYDSSIFFTYRNDNGGQPSKHDGSQLLLNLELLSLMSTFLLLWTSSVFFTYPKCSVSSADLISEEGKFVQADGEEKKHLWCEVMSLSIGSFCIIAIVIMVLYFIEHKGIRLQIFTCIKDLKDNGCGYCCSSALDEEETAAVGIENVAVGVEAGEMKVTEDVEHIGIEMGIYNTSKGKATEATNDVVETETATHIRHVSSEGVPYFEEVDTGRTTWTPQKIATEATKDVVETKTATHIRHVSSEGVPCFDEVDTGRTTWTPQPGVEP